LTGTALCAMLAPPLVERCFLKEARMSKKDTAVQSAA
jgi:hypothetical protein